ncbi:glycosyltransferase [Proteus columbae]|uniref:glycosyltransferase family 8 protein n=1 Tax=Proteus columbae TaxID=1987580 RepID=UPI00288A760C|nr:glycosyltransferase [Proteus columbae]
MDLSSIIKNTEILFESNGNGDVFHVAFAVDENYMKPAGVMISSIIKNNPHGHFYFHIFTTSIKDDDVHRFKKLENNHCSLCIRFFDENIFSQLQTLENLPISMYYRLVIPYALKNITDRVLYLDSDMLCIGDIYSLIELDFNNNIIAAVHDECVPSKYIKEIGLRNDDVYFNSGVIYFNIPKWIGEDILSLFMELIGKRKYNYPDQDVLNLLLNNKVKFLPKYYNSFFYDDRNIDENVILLHYAGPSKPWYSIDRAGVLYKEYYDCSSWGDIPLRMPKDYVEYRRYSKIKFRTKHIGSGIFWNARYILGKLTKKHKK